ncbi:F-box/LRR-repeat protein 12-like [Sapajus apella]|uniref:F-box/LRR-repeat protein 12-like n=1 Tax=Sapajus apella TaxID=9515 RepID=A0A6J3IZJ7_SAPAP|nr:F-box/LRR-repeat protein 12-like [Sapajus apella]
MRLSDVAPPWPVHGIPVPFPADGRLPVLWLQGPPTPLSAVLMTALGQKPQREAPLPTCGRPEHGAHHQPAQCPEDLELHSCEISIAWLLRQPEPTVLPLL